MKLNGIIVIAYGILVLIGGVIGFIKAQSTPSLFVGSIFACLLIGAGIGIFNRVRACIYLALISTLFLGCFFAYRFFLTYKMMPSGIMTLISGLIFIALLLKKDPSK
jgi:uncharacterized membrane protein (UPF0136 family)